jgi:hypothetical protein
MEYLTGQKVTPARPAHRRLTHPATEDPAPLTLRRVLPRTHYSSIFESAAVRRSDPSSWSAAHAAAPAPTLSG